MRVPCPACEQDRSALRGTTRGGVCQHPTSIRAVSAGRGRAAPGRRMLAAPVLAYQDAAGSRRSSSRTRRRPSTINQPPQAAEPVEPQQQPAPQAAAAAPTTPAAAAVAALPTKTPAATSPQPAPALGRPASSRPRRRPTSRSQPPQATEPPGEQAPAALQPKAAAAPPAPAPVPAAAAAAPAAPVPSAAAVPIATKREAAAVPPAAAPVPAAAPPAPPPASPPPAAKREAATAAAAAAPAPAAPPPAPTPSLRSATAALPAAAPAPPAAAGAPAAAPPPAASPAAAPLPAPAPAAVAAPLPAAPPPPWSGGAPPKPRPWRNSALLGSGHVPLPPSTTPRRAPKGPLPPALPAWVGPAAEKYRFRSPGGAVVYAAVEPEREGEGEGGAGGGGGAGAAAAGGDAYVVTLSVPAHTLPRAPALQWGLYRHLPTEWVAPKKLWPPGSRKASVARGAAAETPMTLDAPRGAWVARVRVPRRMAPAQLGFRLVEPSSKPLVEEEEAEVDPLMAVPPTRGAPTVTPPFHAVALGTLPGSPLPLGPSLVARDGQEEEMEEGRSTVNFAVVSRHARSVSLCLLRRDGSTYLEISLHPETNKTGDVWHVAVPGLRSVGGLLYGWRASDEREWAEGSTFHPGYLLLDPYCPRVLPLTLPEVAYDGASALPPEGRMDRPVMLGSLCMFGGEEPFDWGGAELPLSPSEGGLMVEVDVAGFTSGPDAEKRVPLERRGTYLGVIDRLPELCAAGASAVALTPIMACGASGAAASGRAPLSLMAPDPALAAGADPAAAAGQVQSLVRACHEAGLEVYLEVELCWTAESVEGSSRLQSLRGLDALIYFRPGSGVLNTGQAAVHDLVLASLRAWAEDARVDGFVFLNAENMVQDALGCVLDSPPLVEAITGDPVLSRLKLIAAPNSEGMLPRSGVRGFPHYGVWAQWNGRYADSVTAVLRDNALGRLSEFATRIAGSPDLTAECWDQGLPGGLAVGRRASLVYNSLTPPGGPGLLEWAGGMDALDRSEVVARSLLLAALVSKGTPVINAATLARKGLLRFASLVGQLRRSYAPLLQPGPHGAWPVLTWHGLAPQEEPQWNPPEGGDASAFAALSVVAPDGREALYIAFNPSDLPAPATLPPPPPLMRWRVLVDTARLPPGDVPPEGGELLESEYILAPCAALLLDVVPAPSPGLARPAQRAAAAGQLPRAAPMAASSAPPTAARAMDVYRRFEGAA